MVVSGVEAEVQQKEGARKWERWKSGGGESAGVKT